MKTGDLYLTCFLFAIGFAIYLSKAVATQDQDSWKVIGAKAVLNGFTSLMARCSFDVGFRTHSSSHWTGCFVRYTRHRSSLQIFQSKNQ